MTVVADTSPLNYLILIEEIDLLEKLYAQVLIPRSVYEELHAIETPEKVRTWIANPPMWLRVITVPSSTDDSLQGLHLGEREVLVLGLQEKTDAAIIDERRGREEAEKRGLKVIGTLGVLVAAHANRLLDLGGAIERLRQTTFHVSPKLLEAIVRKY